jgi:hypothetical protein
MTNKNTNMTLDELFGRLLSQPFAELNGWNNPVNDSDDLKQEACLLLWERLQAGDTSTGVQLTGEDSVSVNWPHLLKRFSEMIHVKKLNAIQADCGRQGSPRTVPISDEHVEIQSPCNRETRETVEMCRSLATRFLQRKRAFIFGLFADGYTTAEIAALLRYKSPTVSTSLRDSCRTIRRIFDETY